MFVKPGISKGTGKPLVVRIPVTHALMPETGMEVPETAFWIRRLRDGDVVAAKASVEAPEEPAHSA
jgi:hypothetical protein